MAVTAEKSTQVTNQEAANAHLEPNEASGRLRIGYFDFTQGAAAGDANSTVDLAYMPAGRVRVISKLSFITCSAFGSARTLNIGYTAHTDQAGDSVNADEDAVADGLDVSAAADLQMGLSTAAGVAATTLLLNGRDRVLLQAKCLGGTLPAAATLNGFFVYVND